MQGGALLRLERTWANVVLLVVDEVSFIGRAFFTRMHYRLQQAKRRDFRERGDEERAYFGNISIILVGDFGQLDPIDDWSMCDTESCYQSCPKKLRQLWKQNNFGKDLVQKFDEAVVLTEIHRSSEDKWWTESCLRLRDFTCTKEEDWDYWRLHDLDRGHLTAEQKDYFENKAVWLCARNEDVGTRNGRKLANLVESERHIIHAIKAESRESARKLPSTAFDGLRDLIHLVRECKVMLTRNVAYRYGLANGTRGTLVGVVYGPGGVGTFPEALVVCLPDYCGPCFYKGEPKWVPILPMIAFKENTRITRKQFPVVAGFAMTVNKAQGLTIKEGTVINLVSSARFHPASKHGLPFVAFTRSESFAMTAFKNIPGWKDFMDGRKSKMLAMRLAFTDRLAALHERTLARHSGMETRQQEEAARDCWRQQQCKRPRRAGPLMPCPACERMEAGVNWDTH